MDRAIDVRIVGVVLVLAAVAGLHGTEAAGYTVGDSYGWQNPPNATFYSDWASRHTFVVGDTLTFTFTTGAHNVGIAPSKAALDNCNTGSANSVISNGPATITLNTTGAHYYYCTITGHCSTGQKLTVTVTTGSSSTPSPSGSPSPTGSTTPSPPPPPPPPPSSAGSLSATTALMVASFVAGYLLYF